MIGRGRPAALGALVAVAVAVGLLLMHGGIDPTHRGGHHGAVADRTAVALPAVGDPVDGTVPEGHTGHRDLVPLARICAVFAIVAAAAILRWRRPDPSTVARVPDRRFALPAFVPLVLEPPPRLALCVDRC